MDNIVVLEPASAWLWCLADDRSPDAEWPSSASEGARQTRSSQAHAMSTGVRGRRVTLDDISAARLVARVREGDEDAFRTIYLAFFRPLWEFAHSLVHSADVAEDIVQEVFARWWERRATVEIRTGIDPYLYGGVRYRALQWRRATTLHAREDITATVVAEHAGMAETSRPVDERVHEQDFECALTQAIALLPPLRRAALTLRVRHGLDYTAIGEVLEISAQAAMIHVSRARRGLRELFERYYAG